MKKPGCREASYLPKVGSEVMAWALGPCLPHCAVFLIWSPTSWSAAVFLHLCSSQAQRAGLSDMLKVALNPFWKKVDIR